MPVDRVVTPGARGGWEVRAPGHRGPVLRSDTRREAVQWAWNITRDTGGRVMLQARSGEGPG